MANDRMSDAADRAAGRICGHVSKGIGHGFAFSQVAISEAATIIREEYAAQPPILYHGTARKFRGQILSGGLNPENYDTKGLYFTSKICPHDLEKPLLDIWAVDVRGLHLGPDDTTEAEEETAPWFVCYQRIDATRLCLITRAQPHPSIRERAEAAADELLRLIVRCGMTDSIFQFPLADVVNWPQRIARHFSDLSPDAELREAAQRGLKELEDTSAQRDIKLLRELGAIEQLRAALEGAK